MDSLESVKIKSVKQEPEGSSEEHNMGNILPLEPLKSGSIKPESRDLNECNISSNIPLEFATSVTVKQELELEEQNLNPSVSLKEIKADDAKQKLEDEPHSYNMRYCISLESVKMEDLKQDTLDLGDSTDVETVSSENIKQEALQDSLGNMCNNSASFGVLRQHLNSQTLKSNELRTYNYQKERLKQCIERISFIEQHINTHIAVNSTCDESSANKPKKRRIRPPGVKRYECESCGFKVARPSQLESHKRTHTGEKPHQCNMCHFKSARLSTLKQHIITHTGEKPFKCDICDFKTAHAIDLKRHIKTHTGEKPHKCDVCDYRTIRLNSLKRHMRTHTGEKPYECDMCDYKSPNDNGLRQHKRTHTGEKPYKCNVCDYKSAQSSALKKHMKKHSK